MKKFNTFSIFLLIILFGCTSTDVASNNITGQDIKQRYNKLQSFIYSFENEEQDGAITETSVDVYVINNQQCAIVGRTFGDSGVGGSETLIFFKNKKMLSASLTPFSIVGLKDDAIKITKPKSISYSEPFPNEEVKTMLEEDFKGYIKQINKNTLNNCS